MWFPRVESPDDLVCAGPSGDLTPAAVHALLTDPGAIEWRDRVGVVGARDGSAKSTTRLLVSGDWVFKTDVSQRRDSAEATLEALQELAARAETLGIWHPSKRWLAMRSAGGWLPLTVCRRLVTLRETPSTGARLASVVRMISLGAQVSREHGVGLDLNPSNFGREPGEDRLYYLDDEVYPRLALRDLGACAVSRIPEEPRADQGTWRAFGRKLREAVAAEVKPGGDLSDLFEGAEQYPLTEMYSPLQRALLEGAREGAPVAPAPSKTCLIADVHANLPALEAVVRKSRELGADSYLFLGDAVGYGPHPSEVIALLRSLPNAILIRGNHDDAVATGDIEGMNRLAVECVRWTQAVLSPEERGWLGALPPEHVAPGWLALHGAPIDPRRFNAYVYEMTYQDNLAVLERDGVAACFYGHTHVPSVHRRSPQGDEKIHAPLRVKLAPGAYHLINPGSVGQPRDGRTTASFALWDRSTGEVEFHRVEYALEETLKALREARLPSDLGYRLELGR